MKYAIFSDIHGNLEAFDSVLKHIKKDDPGRHFCIGDIVGYGADPSECIEKLKLLNPATVAGNHDWASAGVIGTGNFNSLAKEAIVWTRDNITSDESAYLGSLQLVYEDGKITLVHGTLDGPGRFSYVLDGHTAAKTFALMKTQVCFIGHSHIAGTFYESKGDVAYSSLSAIKIKPDHKYIINIGSVGQPRDGDPRCSYCIYDDEKNTVEIKRVDYDIKKAKDKILKSKLPGILGERLLEGR